MPHTDHSEQKIKYKQVEDPYAGRLSKRLCYLLRYGALKEGLTVHEGGFVDIKEVMSLSIMRHHTEEETLAEVEVSLSHRNTKRFERKDENGTTLIRALFCRNFEPSEYHDGTKISTLLQTCISFVSNNLQEYDLMDFPDEFLISTMIAQLKKKKKLNSANLKQLLVPVLDHLDLDSVYVTQAVLKAMWTNCPNLRVLSLKDCGYIVTDCILQTILRKLPKLESLCLTACKHVTDKGLAFVCEYGKNIQQLNLSWIRNFSDNALLNLVVNCENLKHLDIYDQKVSDEIKTVMIEAARQRGIKIVLKGLYDTDPDVTFENPEIMMFPNFGKTW